MNTLNARLEKCLLTAFPSLSMEEISRASVHSVAEWDSLALVTLVSLVEEEFAFRIRAEDIEHFVSYELILNYLQSRQSDLNANE